MKLEYHKRGEDAIAALTKNLRRNIDARETEFFTLALSGGSTAKSMFEFWARDKTTLWRKVKFFWADERCVPPYSDESNFKLANDVFFKPLKIPAENIFRIRGEDDPQEESARYSKLALEHTFSQNGMPDFDCTILGMGADGHTASIFPNDMRLLDDPSPYAPSLSPQSGQQRVSMTGRCILNSHEILMPVLGESKADILNLAASEVKSGSISLPSAYILRNSENILLYTDALKPHILG